MPQNNQKHPGRFRLVAIGLALLLAVISFAACGNDNAGGEPVGDINPSDIVAKYEGGQVTGKELIGFLGAHKFFNLDEMYSFYEMLPSFKQDMLYQLIGIRHITAGISDELRKESEQSADETMGALEESLASDAEFKASFEEFMKQEGITKDDLRDYVMLTYNLQSALWNKFSDEEIRAKFDQLVAENGDAFTRATVRHILVNLTDDEGNERTEEDALKRAKEAQAKLKNGGDWTAIAKEYSDDPGSKNNGGKYEDQLVSQWVQEFKQHAIEQPIGEIGEPFLTSYGYHVMLVEARRQSEFDEVKGQVESQLVSEYFSNVIEVEVPAMVTEVNLPESEVPEGFGEVNGGSETNG